MGTNAALDGQRAADAPELPRMAGVRRVRFPAQPDIRARDHADRTARRAGQGGRATPRSSRCSSARTSETRRSQRIKFAWLGAAASVVLTMGACVACGLGVLSSAGASMS